MVGGGPVLQEGGGLTVPRLCFKNGSTHSTPSISNNASTAETLGASTVIEAGTSLHIQRGGVKLESEIP